MRTNLSVLVLIIAFGLIGCSTITPQPTIIPSVLAPTSLPFTSKTPHPTAISSPSLIPSSTPYNLEIPTKQPTLSQPDPYLITKENVGQLVYLNRFGDEWIDTISWSPNGNSIASASSFLPGWYDVNTYDFAPLVESVEEINERLHAEIAPVVG